MRFELTPARKQYSNSELLDNLVFVAKNLNKRSLKQKDYSKQNGAKYSCQTYKKRFGSWGVALSKAGLLTESSVHGIEYGESSIRENLLIEDIKSVADRVGSSAPTLEDYIKHGKYSSSAVCKRFGGWNKAKEKAGLVVGRRYNSSNEDYFKNLEEVWQKLGRQPRYQEMIKPLSKFHISSYENRFGTYRNALEKFVEYMNDTDVEEIYGPVNNVEKLAEKEIINQVSRAVVTEKIPKRKTTRNINWRLRFIVMKNDNFRCKSCGRSPATDPSIVLHVDHIKAWANGGETVLENLQTLCSVCNIGKSNIE